MASNLYKGTSGLTVTLLCRLGQGRSKPELMHCSLLGSSQWFFPAQSVEYIQLTLRISLPWTTSRKSFQMPHLCPASLSGKIRACLGHSSSSVVSPAASCLPRAWLTSNNWKRPVCPQVPELLPLHGDPHCSGEPSDECELEFRRQGLGKAANFPRVEPVVAWKGGHVSSIFPALTVKSDPY